MKVLWFCNTPGLASQHLNASTVGGGWITALQTKVAAHPDIDLGYVFYHDSPMDAFTHGQTQYFPIKRIGSNKWKRLAHRYTGKVEYKENLAAFLQVIERFKPDVIHIHGTENPFGLIIPHVQDIPVAISIQGNLTVYEKKYFAAMQPPSFWGMLDAHKRQVLQAFSAFRKKAVIEREILQHCLHVFGRTDWDRRISKTLAPNSQYHHIDEVIRPGFYALQWQAASQPQQKVKILTTASDSLYKGFETVLETCQLLSNIGFSFEWSVAGLNPGDHSVALCKQATGIQNLENINLKLLGKLNEEALTKAMLSTNLYAQVSHIENSPNSLCEAMLMGLPIVATHAGGTSTLVENNHSGVLVQDGDPYALSGALIELANNPEHAGQLGQQAQRDAHLRHDPDRILNALLKAYQHMSQLENTVMPQPC